jgi:hypothetical protein
LVVTRRSVLLGSAASLAGLAALRAAAQGADPGHDHPTPAADVPGSVRRKPARPDAYVYIGWPQEGQTIYSTRFKVWFGTRNFGIAPAGVEKPNTGHHHLLVDTDLPPLDREIPNNRNHLHFGLGQTEVMLELPPGSHTLQLLLGDENHVPHDPPVMSRRITIQVRSARPSGIAAAAQQ